MTNYVWIARDEDGHLSQFDTVIKPTINEDGLWISTARALYLSNDALPEVKPGECVRFALVRADEEGGEG